MRTFLGNERLSAGGEAHHYYTDLGILDLDADAISSDRECERHFVLMK